MLRLVLIHRHPRACPRHRQVAGRLCEKEVPPVRMLDEGHQIKCHLSDEELNKMTPVIKIAAE